MRPGVIPWKFIEASFEDSQGIISATFFKQKKVYKDKSEKVVETLDSEWEFYGKLREQTKQSEFKKNIRELKKDNLLLLKNYVGWETWNQIIDKVSNFNDGKRKEVEERLKSLFNVEVNILLMRAEENILRTALGEDPEVNIFSGEKKSKEKYWEGDENIYKYSQNEDKILLYVYNYKIKNEETEVKGLFYAFRFPQTRSTKTKNKSESYYTSQNIGK